MLLALVPARAQELKKLSLDDTSTLGLSVQADAAVKVEGKASLRITTARPTTVCLGEVTGLDVDDVRLVFKAKVKTELEGGAFLEMWVTVGAGEFFSKGLDNQAAGKSDWKNIQAMFLLKKGEKAEKVTLNVVVNGKGTVWVDDVVLSREPPK